VFTATLKEQPVKISNYIGAGRADIYQMIVVLGGRFSRGYMPEE
jgi:hypothetical protein